MHSPAHLPACAVDDITAPYVKQTITELQEKGVTVKPYGEQVVVLTVDAWWGWLSQRFRTHIRSKYPWIRLVFVPGRTTSEFQPMDQGVITMIKASIRAAFATWVAAMTVTMLALNGNDPSHVHIPFNKAEVSAKFSEWVSAVYFKVQSDPSLQAKVRRAWEKSGLLRAWDRDVQREAVLQAGRIFRNVDRAGVECEPPTDEREAANVGEAIDGNEDEAGVDMHNVVGAAVAAVM